METLDPCYRVYAIRYATARRHAGENFIGGDPHETAVDMDYYVWVARSTDHLFVIDTGFTRESAESRGRTFLRCPSEGLEALDIAPSDVDSVILTHLHYDHAGNLDLFPNADFHLQDREMSFATGRYMRHRVLRSAYTVEDVVSVVRNVYAGRVHFIDGSAELTPGVHVHHVGGHTAGLQVVQIHTAKGWLVLASDTSHYYANFETRTPFPIVHDVGAMLEGYDRLRMLASSPELIVPGHDPAVMDRFEAPTAETRGILVQLA